jgi:DnaA family protein
MMVTPQILLPLEGHNLERFEDYLPGPNRAVVSALQDMLHSRGACLFIHGAQGSGKTHLLNATCNFARDQGQGAFYLGLAHVPENAAAGLAGLESMDLVCIDDIDRAAGNPAWENPLFHFFNQIRSHGGRMVVSSSCPLSSMAFQLPDLASRLAWGLRLQLEPLDDRDKMEVLRRKAMAAGFELPAEVARYLLSRESRNLASLVNGLEAIRREALRQKRRITLPLAREALGRS